MRTFRYVFALFAAALLVPGCGDDPGSLTHGRNPYGAAADTGEGDPAAGADAPTPVQTAPAAPPHDASFADRTLTRARAWIDASMPYCGGPNGGKDVNGVELV